MKKDYLALYVVQLKGCGMTEELELLFNDTIDPGNMGSYVNDYLLPKLTQMRKEDKLQPNQTSMVNFQGHDYHYTGDVDCNGKATGWGRMNKKGTQLTVSGTFLFGQVEGVF